MHSICHQAVKRNLSRISAGDEVEKKRRNSDWSLSHYYLTTRKSHFTNYEGRSESNATDLISPNIYHLTFSSFTDEKLSGNLDLQFGFRKKLK